MKRFTFITLIFLCTRTFAQDKDNTFIAKPYLQIGREPSPTTLELLWQVPENTADWIVEVKTSSTGKWQKTESPQWVPVAPAGLQPRRVYHVKLTNLIPGDTFSYRVSKAGKSTFTAEGRAPKSETQPYRFVVNGDIGAATTDAKLLAKQSFLTHPDLVVIPGDIIYENGRVSEYDDKFWPIYNADQTSDEGAPLMRSIPYIGAPGNHDVDNRSLDQFPDGLAYYFFWRQPLNGPAGKEGDAFVPTMTATAEHRKAFMAAAGEAYPNAVNYSFNYGNAHWMVIDSDPYVDWTDSSLRDWVKKDLATAQNATWRFVIFHHPPFSSAREHYEQQQTRLLSPLFEAGKVDLVFSGHVHNYQRSFPMTFAPDKKGTLLMGGKDNKLIRGRVVNGSWKLDRSFDGATNTKPNGIIYVITGAGGQELYNPEQTNDPDSWQKYTDKFISNVHSLSVVDINGKTLTLRQISPDGKQLDSIKITKGSATETTITNSPVATTHPAIPAVLDGVEYRNGKLTLTKAGNVEDLEKKDVYTLSSFTTNPTGTETGIAIDIHQPGLNGTVAYGPVDETATYPMVAFLPKDVKMTDGKALLEIKKVFTHSNDFFKFEEKAKGIIGYRIIDATGRILYEGRVAFEGAGPYTVVPTLIEGPMINDLHPTTCVISFETQTATPTTVTVNNQVFPGGSERHHEVLITGLQPATAYTYTVTYGNRRDTHTFQTATAEGSRKPFTFAFASANRATTGGGERDFGGTNYQTSRTIMAAAAMNQAAFIQVQGDITNGANPGDDGHALEYANFKRALEPFWSRIPVYVGFGDHEASRMVFAPDPGTKKSKTIEAFPYATSSGEASFAKAFVNPTNGPASEDGASYDPNPGQPDFPTYKENVYYYSYDNVAMIVLNTEYWESKDPMSTSGCPEGYIMDQQVKWLRGTMNKMENDPHIDHIFVVTHGAVFPNGDHLADAMWWDGDNTSRAVVAGIPLSKGTIERRDEILDICVNNSRKFLAFISGDEHNFSFLPVTPQTPIYLDNYTGKRLQLQRSFFCINNGAGGSAPYAMLPSPWSGGYKFFTEPPALALIHVDGSHVTLAAQRMETFEKICENIQLR